MVKATLVYIVEGEQVLMLHRNKRPNDVHWKKYVGVGGKFEAGETAEECMKREVLEETGLHVLDYQLAGEIFFPAFDGEQDIFTYVYRVTKTSGELQENHEGELSWFHKDDILDLSLWEGDRVFLPWVLEEGPFFEATFFYKEGSFQDYQVKFGGRMNPKVRLRLETGEEMIMELYPEIAPQTVDNFIHLVEKGFYDGLIFHRVIPGFMIQGGCPMGTGTGGPGYHIPGEFKSNGFENNLKHEPGVLSMARAMDPDSAGSQFFIMHKTSPHLDGDYAAFGKVIEGLEVVDKIASVQTGAGDRPLEDVVIDRIDVIEE